MSVEHEVPAGYKRTEVGVIPQDWAIHSLGSICDVRDGTHESPQFFNDGVPFVTSKNIADGRLDLENVSFISKDDAIAFNKRSKVDRNDILLSMIGTIGSAVLVDREPNFCIKNVALIKPRMVAPPYLAHLINAPIFQNYLAGNLDGGIQKFISLGKLRELAIPLPAEAEQRAIADALGDVDALLDALDRLIAKQRDLKQAAMQQLLTGRTRLPGFTGEWQAQRLGELGDTYGGLVGKSKSDFNTGEGRYIPFVNVMANTRIDVHALGRVRIGPAETQNIVRVGDVVFNGSSETPKEVAMCAVLDIDVPNLYLNSFCFGFRILDSTSIDPLFLGYYFRAEIGRALVSSLAQGSTRYNVSKSAFLLAAIRLPSLAEQTAIATVLSDMDAAIAALEARRAKTRDLKQAMLQELLTGHARLI